MRARLDSGRFDTHGFKPSGFKGLTLGFDTLVVLLEDDLVDAASGRRDLAELEEALKGNKDPRKR